jgi:HEAT repeat protein
MEAQSALVHLSGFGGLWFLNILNYPISEWQQMKLISMLSTSPVSDIPDLHLLLSSPNESLVIFTLKLIGRFQQRTMHNAVVKCLGNKSEAIRYVAIKCLKEINNPYTPGVLVRRFSTETRRNKIAIVNVIGEIGDKDQTDFLLEVLSLNDDTLKIAAARALSNHHIQGGALLEEFCNTQGPPYTQILLHIKSANSYDLV